MLIRSWKPFARMLAVLLLLASVFTPQAAGAAPDQEEEKTTRDKRAEVQERQEEVAGEVGTLATESEELSARLLELEAQVAEKQAELEEAERAAVAAEEDLREAEEAVAAAQWRIGVLDAAIDEFVVEAYVSPPAEGVFDAFAAETMSDAAVKKVLIDLQSNADADLLDQLELAHEDLDIERANRQEIAEEAEATRQAVAATVEELRAAQAEQADVAAEAEAAVERKLAEAAVLEERDSQLAEQIRQEDEALRQLARQIEAQRRAAEARRQAEAAASGGGASGGGSSGSGGGGGGGSSPAPAPSSVRPAPGGLATVSCPGGGAITVAGSIASNLGGLLNHAWSDGIALCGWGYRSPQRQIELRSINGCPDTYSAPPSSCRVPTARPGTSMHERGLAVDFTCSGGSIGTRSSPCFRWLNSHGLYNLPSEPWHWSTNGG
jgi:peptidoglycan hydrolase CwlO-like protein